MTPVVVNIKPVARVAGAVVGANSVATHLSTATIVSGTLVNVCTECCKWGNLMNGNNNKLMKA